MKAKSKKVAMNVLVLAVAIALPELAMAAGVNKSDSGLNSLNTWLSSIFPIIAGLGGVITFILYMFGQIGKQIFQQLLTGLIGAGSISWIISLFL